MLTGTAQQRGLDEFNARIVQGKATLLPRLEAVPARMPLPAARHQGSIHKNQRTLETRYFTNLGDSCEPK